MTVLHDGNEFALHDLLARLTSEQIDRAWDGAEEYQQVWDRVCTLFPGRVEECLAHARESQAQREDMRSRPPHVETDPILIRLHERDHHVFSEDEKGWR